MRAGDPPTTIDDLGYGDTQIINPNSWMTPTFGSLAKEGVVLERHHTFMYCSPTRRSFLSGRFPVHISESNLSELCSNYLPLEFTWLSGKLKQAGYASAFLGKGHL